MMTLIEFKTKLETKGLGMYFERFRPLLRDTIRLYQKEADEKDIAIGQTKLVADLTYQKKLIGQQKLIPLK